MSQNLVEDSNDPQNEINAESLLQGFRHHYHKLESTIRTAFESGTDPGRLSRIGDDLDEYIQLVQQVLINLSKLYLKVTNILT